MDESSSPETKLQVSGRLLRVNMPNAYAPMGAHVISMYLLPFRTMLEHAITVLVSCRFSGIVPEEL